MRRSVILVEQPVLPGYTLLISHLPTCSCIEYTSPWIEIKKLVMMRTGCIGACKSTKKDTVATFR